MQPISQYPATVKGKKISTYLSIEELIGFRFKARSLRRLEYSRSGSTQWLPLVYKCEDFHFPQHRLAYQLRLRKGLPSVYLSSIVPWVLIFRAITVTGDGDNHRSKAHQLGTSELTSQTQTLHLCHTIPLLW